ncbi:MAG TPA: helix-turn-helix transcriptional regulator [Anaerolineales bacterium]|nr:helix-turn-helix transcriptional regulator [Anaerolineales bacterium]
MKNEDISSKDTLRAYLQSHAKKRGITLRKIGEALGIKPAYFSGLITGNKKRSVEFLNALADYLEAPRVEVYQAAGLLQISEYESLRAKLDNLLMNEPTARQALDMLVGLEREDMLKLASWMIINAVELTQQRRSGRSIEGQKELLAFPEDSKLPPPAFMNMIYQMVSQYFRPGSKGELTVDPKYDPLGDQSEYDGEEIDLDDDGEPGDE